MPVLLKSFLLFMLAVSDQAKIPQDHIWKGGVAPASHESCELKIASWNIERGEQLQALIPSLKDLSADVVLIQECDMNAKRTGNRNIAEVLAGGLGMRYLFAAEFEELGQRVRNMPAYHGQAILTALPVSSSHIIRFRTQTDRWQPRWYLPNWSVFQRRTGGRLALAAELGSGDRRFVVYNVHLESRGPEEIRLNQIEDVIADAKRYSTETPILLAGDLNTRAPDAPAIKALLEAGFRKAVGQEVTTTRGAALDWIFVRGALNHKGGSIHKHVKASDHYPLTVEIQLNAPDCR